MHQALRLNPQILWAKGSEYGENPRGYHIPWKISRAFTITIYRIAFTQLHFRYLELNIIVETGSNNFDD